VRWPGAIIAVHDRTMTLTGKAYPVRDRQAQTRCAADADGRING
jgi:hypothetical protein